MRIRTIIRLINATILDMEITRGKAGNEKRD
jgi:hypothetical protein